MANIAHNAHWLHRGHMFGGDHVGITCRCAENVRARHGFFHRYDFKAFHGGLERTDGVDFRHHHACAAIAQRLG